MPDRAVDLWLRRELHRSYDDTLKERMPTELHRLASREEQD